MLFASSAQGHRIQPSRGTRAACGQCGGEVLAKCGKLVSWHWAHRVAECDTWGEGESDWHLAWKRAVTTESCEVVMGNHRADIRTAEGVVVELQHSPIEQDMISERERFYGSMRWLFDARAFDLALLPRDARVDFIWQRPRKSLLSVRAPMFWDLGHGFVLCVSKLKPDSPLGGCAGQGTLLDAACFASQCFGSSAQPEIHTAALSRVQRVHYCLARARRHLLTQPSAGPDEALRSALSALDLSDLTRRLPEVRPTSLESRA